MKQIMYYSLIREPSITTIPKSLDYLSSAITLKAGSTERMPNTSSMSFSLKLSQFSYTCQLQRMAKLNGCLCRWGTIQRSKPSYYSKQITMLTCSCSRQLDYSVSFKVCIKNDNLPKKK